MDFIIEMPQTKRYKEAIIFHHWYKIFLRELALDNVNKTIRLP